MPLRLLDRVAPAADFADHLGASPGGEHGGASPGETSLRHEVPFGHYRAPRHACGPGERFASSWAQLPSVLPPAAERQEHRHASLVAPVLLAVEVHARPLLDLDGDHHVGGAHRLARNKTSGCVSSI